MSDLIKTSHGFEKGKRKTSEGIFNLFIVGCYNKSNISIRGLKVTAEPILAAVLSIIQPNSGAEAKRGLQELGEKTARRNSNSIEKADREFKCMIIRLGQHMRALR